MSTPTIQLDDEWIKNFEKEDKPYEEFYKEDIFFIYVHFIYINQNNEIEKIKEEKFFMSIPNYITREETLYLLKKNSVLNNTRYSILSLLKYNFHIESEEIKQYISTQDLDESLFLTTVKNVDEIRFEKTIDMFHDLNELFFILYENPRKTTNGNNQTKSNTTKKLYIRAKTNKKNTRRH